MKRMQQHFVALFFLNAIKLAICACPSGWTDGVGLCYLPMVDFTDFVHWGYANAWCHDHDIRATLPMFKDSMTWNVFQMGVKTIKGKLEGATPPPGTDPAHYIPFGLYKYKDEWLWIDGTKLSDTDQYWQKGEPNGTNTKLETCVGFNPINGDSGYCDIPCNLEFGFVCQLDPELPLNEPKNPGTSNAVMSEPSGACPAGWDTAKNKVCYKTPTDSVTIATPDAGLAACAKLDPKSKLPEFYNDHDWDSFIRYIGKDIGPDHIDIALGVRNKNGYVNSDGKTYVTNWFSGEPKESKPECVFMNDLKGYKWEAKDCSTSAYIVCQLDTRTVQSVVAKPNAQAQGSKSGGSDSERNNDGGGGDAGGGTTSSKTSASSAILTMLATLFAKIVTY